MLRRVNDEGLDQTLRQQDGDALAREGARDAKAVAQDGDSNHLVLRHFREELVVRGLLFVETNFMVSLGAVIVAARESLVQDARSPFRAWAPRSLIEHTRRHDDVWRYARGRTCSKSTWLFAFSFILPLDHFCRRENRARD